MFRSQNHLKAKFTAMLAKEICQANVKLADLLTSQLAVS